MADANLSQIVEEFGGGGFDTTASMRRGTGRVRGQAHSARAFYVTGAGG
jgi:hypothetical protein